MTRNIVIGEMVFTHDGITWGKVQVADFRRTLLEDRANEKKAWIDGNELESRSFGVMES